MVSQFYALGNKKYQERLLLSKKQLSELIVDTNKKILWVHASSYGEFEQAKYIIEELKEKHNFYILVSFFSPSAYNNQKNYAYADQIIYLPFDSYFYAKKLVQIINPDYFILVRYDFWLNHLVEIRKKAKKAILINATEPKFKNILTGFFYKEYCNQFDKVFASNLRAYEFFNKIDKSKTIISKDTRYDRINNVVEKAQILEKFQKFKTDKLILVAGSTWLEDEQLLSKVQNDKLMLIIVPHEPNSNHIEKSLELFPDSQIYTKCSSFNDNNPIIIDTIGILLTLYKIADIAYVGGGFGAGLHSVSEPAGFGLPILASGNINTSIDAVQLEKSGGLINIKEFKDLDDSLELLYNKNRRKETGINSKNYIKNNLGASEEIINLILN